MGALLAGVYDGEMTTRELLRHGDFGLGTFNALDGEILVHDGVGYQLRSDGSAPIADPAELSPFAPHTDRQPAVQSHSYDWSTTCPGRASPIAVG